MPLHPRRYSKVGWLGPQDLEPYGDPEVTIHRGRTIAHHIRVPSPFGRDTDAVIVVTADAITEVISLAIEGLDG